MTYRDSSSDLPRSRSPVAVRVDNLIRMRLGSGDPRSAAAVAEGLRKLYPEDARRQDLEASGLPELPRNYGRAGPRPAESAATSAELVQAIADVDRDLEALTTDHRLKDITAELQGWGQALRPSIADGAAAARLALDPRARDRVFGARRILGDYARLARFVGALTATMSMPYRKLAQSLDEVSNLLLVLAGEALAGAGLGGGRFLLSVPSSELQTRRDSVLSALRSLQGNTAIPQGQGQWPWGLHGVREMLLLLENSGHLDLRALLDESVLGDLMDRLIERAGQQNVLGLRALGATADVALNSLHRFLLLVDQQVQPPSPAVMSFQKAIQLFLDAFRASKSGYRLLFVGRAPIAFYGLGGIGGPDTATQRLINLIIARGRLAEMLDCYLGCECCENQVICQILLDKLLYDTDRAIDLYTLGSDPNGAGEPEWRASAYGLLINSFMNKEDKCLEFDCLTRLNPATQDQDGGQASNEEGGLIGQLERISSLLLVLHLNKLPSTEQKNWMRGELCMQELSDQRLASVLATLAPGCVSGKIALDRISQLVQSALGNQDGRDDSICKEANIRPPPTVETSLEFFNRVNQQFDNVLGGRTRP